jgi:outer membrane receptor protein involved in Fe transport
MQPLWRYENVEDVRIYGLEALFELQPLSGIYGTVCFSVQRGDNQTSDEPIFVSPIKSAVSLGYQYPWQKLYSQLTLRLAADQNRVPSTSALDDISTKGYAVIDASVGLDLYDQIRLSLTGVNLLDETYSEPFNGRNPDNPLPEAGRSFILSLSTGIGQ